MKTAKILFKFTFKDDSIMKVSHLASSENSDEFIIGKAWQHMARDEFNRKLIAKTVKIEVEKIEFIQSFVNL